MKIRDCPKDRVAHNWIDAALPNDADQLEYARERARSVILEALGQAIEHAGITRAALAEKLGTSKANISNRLSQENVTLTTVGSILYGCGFELVDVELAPLGVAFVERKHAAGSTMESVASPAMIFTPADDRWRITKHSFVKVSSMESDSIYNVEGTASPRDDESVRPDLTAVLA